MMDVSIPSHKMRLWLLGLLVVTGSVVTSVAATHLTFSIDTESSYRTAMTASVLIPLIISPLAYGFCAALSLRLIDANAELHRLARQDDLTGLLNRRAFLERAAAKKFDSDAPMLVMVDIDHFKRINDTKGHAAGDLALQHVARMLKKDAPSGSLVARLGGEEFAILVPTMENWTPAEGAIEAIRQCLAATPIITPAGAIRLTASFGLAIARPGDSLDKLLSRADDALYAAKNAGRNRLMHAAV